MGTSAEYGQTMAQWPAVSYETKPWASDPDLFAFIPKSRRRSITQTYEASVPPLIADTVLEMPPRLSARLASLLVDLSRFDAAQEARGYDLPALLLRSESAASSQIERLTSSVRNVALAEVSEDAPRNARLIAGNVAAMRTALSLPDELSVAGICEVHRSLMGPSGESFGGRLRDEQVWVGGTAYSPHGALFVPPCHERVPGYLDDLVRFAGRDDMNPIAKAALLHAQFETVHPFIDGNGRTGRTLLHKVLRGEGVLQKATLPLSAGLLHDIDGYMAAIRDYQRGNPLPIVERLADALELAVSLGLVVSGRIDGVLSEWRSRMRERRGSAILRLPDVLVEQPVVDARYLSTHLGITPRATTSLLERACSYGVLRPVGGARRGGFYQADDLLAVLEEIADVQGIRRVLAGGRAG